MNYLLKSQNIGFVGAGNMTQSVIKGLLTSGQFLSSHIYVSNRSHGKLKKLEEQYKIIIAESNEKLVESSNVIVLAVKPQDLLAAIEPISQFFTQDKIVISLAAGITLEILKKYLPQARIVRVMPNTPSLIREGLIGVLSKEKDDYVISMVEDLFETIGKVIVVDDEDQFEALMIACSSGTGFLFELMLYWQEWIEQHGFSPKIAKEMTLKTFLGAAKLADLSQDMAFEDLQNRVASKKGCTAAGLESMRDLEIERALRISFEKAAMRNKELAREIN